MDKAAGDLAQAAASAGSAGAGAAALAKDHKDSVQEESELEKLSQGGPEGPQKRTDSSTRQGNRVDSEANYGFGRRPCRSISNREKN